MSQVNDHVCSYLDVSTAHITPQDAEILETYPDELIMEAHREYGWWIWVDSDSDIPSILKRLRNAGLSENFCMIMAKAKCNGCSWILLDRDGPWHADIPEYDW